MTNIISKWLRLLDQEMHDVINLRRANLRENNYGDFKRENIIDTTESSKIITRRSRNRK
jgi:hypothetical protein